MPDGDQVGKMRPAGSADDLIETAIASNAEDRVAAMEWAARIWTRPENASRTMDEAFAISIAEALLEREKEPPHSPAVAHGQLVVEFLDQLVPRIGSDPHVLAGLATAHTHHVLPILG